jgi:hypothetical protein
MVKLAETNTNDPSDTRKNHFGLNLGYILLYALAFTVALGLNDLAMAIFSKISKKQNILAKIVYVIIMLLLTLVVAYWMSGNVKIAI